ncbi:MAG TPA: enoyl-CoA hydratase-related protein [Kofleriaceae bacterium]|jgi:enoyl-CoA hydratase/carnithine racemase|nr:enoyl-CoA hydratase-related protein [Kofleriaceae bacterium]
MTDVDVEYRGSAAWVTLNRPEVRNALSRDVNLRLQELASALEQREDVHVIVITGAGDKAFCAGADLKERRGVPATETGTYLNAISGAINGWGDLRKPTICAMNGSAYGGGLELALACDFRILVEGAEVGLTEVKLGIMPGAGGTQRLPRLIGEARAKELILLGRRIPASRALEIGLVHQVVSRGGLTAAVEALLAELATCAPLSVQFAKSAIQRGYGKPISEGLDIERECYDVTLFSDDRDEGLAAFAEGRAPRYRGH